MLLILNAIVVTLVSLLIIGIVLLQNPKEEGNQNLLNNNIEQMIGASHVTNVLEKITYSLGIIFFVLILTMSFLLKRQADAQAKQSANLERVSNYTQKNTPSDTRPKKQKNK